MTVKQLKELLADAPDNIEVMVAVENHLHPGMLAFAPACPCETGVSTLGEGLTDDEGGEEVFLILPHGHTVPEEDLENGEAIAPELN